MTVVKADAYGHGLKQIAARLMQSGTDIFGVANLAEAQSIRSVGKGWPILMLGAALPGEVETAVRDGVMPTISTLEEAQRFASAGRKLGRTVSVHVKVDTGMGRLGVRPEAALKLVRRIREVSNLDVQGIYTHFSSVEDDVGFSRRQLDRFREVISQLEAANLRPPLVHANNSGALLHEPDSLFNLVRLGLLVYGSVPPGRRRTTTAWQNHLRAAMTWKCRVSLVKVVGPGTPLSYGCTFIAPRAMRVATLTAGYGDGYLRAGSNRARVIIRGRRCPVLGRITMDQMLADVSRVRGVAVGDEVVLIGRQGSEEITVNEVAAWFGTIPWEVFTSITYRVPRLYRGSHAA
jgi:alanine racemase